MKLKFILLASHLEFSCLSTKRFVNLYCLEYE